MIPAPPGIVALYRIGGKDPAKSYQHQEPVLAFDDDGEPLVLDRHEGLRPARLAGSSSNYEGTEYIGDELRHVIPGGGWLARITSKNGSRWTVPVLAWAFQDGGYGRPIMAEPDGGASPLKVTDYADVELLHPDEREDNESLAADA
jgi:hypothetical protein